MKKLLIAFASLALVASAQAQNIVLGKSAKDTVKEAFWAQNGNTASTVTGLNANRGAHQWHEDLVPSLPASKITSGTFDAARIPDLNASKITAGTLGASRVTSASAGQVVINSGGSLVGDAGLTYDAALNILYPESITTTYIGAPPSSSLSIVVSDIAEQLEVQIDETSRFRVKAAGTETTGDHAVTGNVTSAAPTLDSHLTPRLYVDTGLSGKADSIHTHAAADITSGNFATARIATGTASNGFVPTSDGSGGVEWLAQSGGGSSGDPGVSNFVHSTSIPAFNAWVTNGNRRAFLNVEVLLQGDDLGNPGHINLEIEGAVTNIWSARMLLDSSPVNYYRTHHFSDVLSPAARWRIVNFSDPLTANSIEKVKVSAW